MLCSWPFWMGFFALFSLPVVSTGEWNHESETACAQLSKEGESQSIYGRFKRSAQIEPRSRIRARQVWTDRQSGEPGTESRVVDDQTENRVRCPDSTASNEQHVSFARNKRQLNRFGLGPPHRPNQDDKRNQNDKKNNSNNGNCEEVQQHELLSRPRIIETAVFIDQALDNKFNGISNGLVELNKLVLTIMNQVQLLFKYSSLHVPITLKLVLVEHIKESERQFEGLQAPNPARGDIDVYLGNFCNWQQMRLEREKRLWWDHAILLSGLDLYKATPGKNHSGVLGLAWVGGMCKGNYSCTINEAPNFEASFVIAHELGHNLGIMHDGQKNRCDPNGFIMSERVGAGKVHWSRCSNSYLNESILSGQLKCLDSEQNGQIDSLYDLSKLRAPGQVYTINEQCKLAFGNNHSSFVTHDYPFNAVCRELWCLAGSSARAAHPALEGSSCGADERVCREGKCVKLTVA